MQWRPEKRLSLMTSSCRKRKHYENKQKQTSLSRRFSSPSFRFLQFFRQFKSLFPFKQFVNHNLQDLKPILGSDWREFFEFTRRNRHVVFSKDQCDLIDVFLHENDNRFLGCRNRIHRLLLCFIRFKQFVELSRI
jgi:hypothetical protein